MREDMAEHDKAIRAQITAQENRARHVRWRVFAEVFERVAALFEREMALERAR